MSAYVKKILTVLMFVCLLPTAGMADAQHGTREEAQALCEKSAVVLQSEGIEKAVAKFQDKAGGFIDRDLYVFALNDSGVFVAHGAKPVMIGKGALDMTDPDGVPFIKEFVAVKDKGWVDYKWPDSSDKNKIKAKSSYIIRVADHVVGVGYYK